jgi:hypothetical protein
LPGFYFGGTAPIWTVKEKIMRHWFILMALLLLSIGCSGREMIPIKGKFFYVLGSTIYELDLEARKEKLLVKFNGLFPSLADVNGEYFLIGTTVEKPEIFLLERNTLRFGDMISGDWPTYMPAHRNFFSSRVRRQLVRVYTLPISINQLKA